MNLKAIYHILCATGDPATVLDRMGDGTLAALSLDLAASGVHTGIPAIVAGLVDMEIVIRWTRDNAPQGGAVGEGATVVYLELHNTMKGNHKEHREHRK